MKPRLLSLIIPTAAVAFMLAGCNTGTTTDNSAPTDTGATENAVSTVPDGDTGATAAATGGEADAELAKVTSKKDLHLAFVANNASAYWIIAGKGVDKAKQQLPNVKVDVKLPGEGTAEEQTRILRDLVANGVEGMAVSPVDPTNQTPLINTLAGQSLIFTQDSDAPKSKRVCYIGTDNVAAGRQAGELVKKALPKGGKIMVFVGKSDAQNAKERYQGLQESLDGSNVSIIDIRTDDTDHAKAKQNASDTITKYPDIAGLVGLWSYNGPAILSAVKDSGKVGKVQIVCFDEEDETLAGIKSGAIYGTVVQQPYEFGYQSIVRLTQYLNGDKSFVPANKQIMVPTKAITKAEVDAFKTNLDKMTGKS